MNSRSECALQYMEVELKCETKDRKLVLVTWTAVKKLNLTAYTYCYKSRCLCSNCEFARPDLYLS